MNKLFVFWRDDEQKKLLSWWASLKDNHGWRAELRRAEKSVDVLLTKGFRALYFEMLGTIWIKEKYLPGLAAAAGIIAHIDYDEKEHSFSAACARNPEKRDKPIVSELRFSQLQKSRSLDELYMRMRRMIHLLGKTVSVVSVADSIMHWFKEMVNEEPDAEPRNRILVRWGLEYFQNLPQTAK